MGKKVILFKVKKHSIKLYLSEEEQQLIINDKKIHKQLMKSFLKRNIDDK